MVKSQLTAFIESFKTEASLRGAIHDLLLRMQGTIWAQLTHGPLEFGKDIVFETRGSFTEKLLCACVIKNCKISGAADDPKGGMATLNQVRQALSQPFVDPSATHKKISRVYVMSPYDLPQTAIRSIEAELQDRAGQLVFLCGQELLNVFEEFYPEYLLLKSSLLTSYVCTLREAFELDGPLHHLSFKHGMLASAKQKTSRAYVRPRFHIEIRGLTAEKCSIRYSQKLDQPLSVNEISDLILQMERLSDFLTVCTAWGKKRSATVSKLGHYWERVQALKRRIEQGWEQRLDEHMVRHEKPRQARNLAAQLVRLSIPLGAFITKDIDFAVGGINKALQSVSAACSSAIASMPESTLALLSSRNYLDYCMYKELSRHSPHLLSQGKIERKANYPESLIEEHRKAALITGPPGYGKTSFCKWSALHDGELFASGDSDVLPVYVPLHRFATSPPESFESSFLGHELVSQLLNEKSKSGKEARLRLYLDGLDEVPTAHQEKIVDLAFEGIQKYPKLETVVTGRDHVTGPWLSSLPRVRISEFNDEKIQNLVAQLLDGNEADVEEFFRQLNLVPGLQQLIRIPLLATLIVAVYEGMTTLPEGKIELYRIFVDLLCGGWDIAKGLRRVSEFGAPLKIRLLIRLATNLQFNGTREANEEVLRSVVKEVSPSNVGRWEALVGDIVQDGLLVREGLGYTFCHHSFQEYLTARDLADPGTDNREQAIIRFLQGDDWWREVVLFYLALSTKPDRLEKLLRQLVSKLIGDPSYSTQKIHERMVLLGKNIEERFPGYKFNMNLSVPVRI